MDQKTTEAMIRAFDKVEDLKLCSDSLLIDMRRWKLVWPSVKRLTVACYSEQRYKGNYSEFPNVQEISLVLNYRSPNYWLRMVKACPQKVTNISMRYCKNEVANAVTVLSEIQGLLLKEINMDYYDLDSEKKFLSRQTKIEAYHVKTHFGSNLQFLPEFRTQAYLHSLELDVQGKTKFRLDLLQNMPNLTKFSLNLVDIYSEDNSRFSYYPVIDESKPILCFLESHDVHVNVSVTKLHFRPGKPFNIGKLSRICLKCVRCLISSFTYIKELEFNNLILSQNRFYHFWKSLNRNFKKTGAGKFLTVLKIQEEYLSPMKVSCDNYKYFKVMAHFPNLKELSLIISHVTVTQRHLMTFCDKCPNFGFLIHQLKYLKHLEFRTILTHIEEKVHGDIYANVDIVDTLLKVPFKLWFFHIPIACENEDIIKIYNTDNVQKIFEMFEKFPSLKEIQVLEPVKNRNYGRVVIITRSEFYYYYKN
ncbi:uncharacterized protein LOC134832216 [Culicoides brevitarsis]|uniref:uncharacterized protein LOC134832216 n=1 Tax=Culicoides brevitarsis TaxID=469753 RepID=UPI00307B949D